MHFRIQNFDADLTFGVPSLFIDFIDVKICDKVSPIFTKNVISPIFHRFDLFILRMQLSDY